MVKNFFNKKEIEFYKDCLNDDYKYFIANNKKDAAALIESSCRAMGNRYTHFSENTIKILDSINNKDRKQDFIILNKTVKSLYNEKPVLSIFKFKNEDKFSVIHNYIDYDQTKKEFISLKDHSLNGFNAEKTLNLFEEYLHYGRGSLISESESKLKNKIYEPEPYYVIARIGGKFLIKKYYYLDKKY